MEDHLTAILAFGLIFLGLGALLHPNPGWKYYVVLGAITAHVVISALWERGLVGAETALMVLIPSFVIVTLMFVLMFRDKRRKGN